MFVGPFCYVVQVAVHGVGRSVPQEAIIALHLSVLTARAMKFVHRA